MSEDRKRPIVVTANWKMYKTIEEATQFLNELLPLVEEKKQEIYIAVPFTAIYSSSQLVKNSKIHIGAQNMNEANEGAFTGEIAGRMLKNAGAEFVILGHSERRIHFHETDQSINLKIKRAIKDGLKPVLCIGESLEERNSGNAENKVKEQIQEGLKDISKEDFQKIMLAYEPIWAIGTGVVATAQEAEQMHHFCRELISQLWDQESAEKCIIQYGGSVKPDNAAELIKQEDIDGLLIGGASLTVKSFVEIMDAVGAT